MIVRSPPSSSTPSSPTSSLSSPSALTEDFDADDEDTMPASAHDFVPPRSLSVTIPKAQGAYCARRPNLKEILSNTAAAPWTLAAFMAYLSQNHCLETLEFTMDASRYRKHYDKMLSKAAEKGGPPSSKDADYVSMLWQRLVDAYIQPNGPREVNLPSEVRDPILNLSTSTLPPAPETLDPAVSKIYELMEDSVLVPFLNSAYPQTAAATASSSCPYNGLNDDYQGEGSQAYEDHSRFHRRSRHARSSPPPPRTAAVEPHAFSYSPPSHLNRKSAPSALSTSLTQRARFAPSSSSRMSPTAAAHSAPLSTLTSAHSSGSAADPTTSSSFFSSSSASTAALTSDDTGSTSSPTADSPMTPPPSASSPPMSDFDAAVRGSSSPRSSRDGGAWKKLGRLSGWKIGRKNSGSLKEEEM
ncbi:hypothetical protein LTR50_001613 [Elasticomyces elasticus]|nr:hypothetical protein LTR50_001613 [Elasticomyces elasticus]